MNGATFNGRVEWFTLGGELPDFTNSHFPNGKNIITKEPIEVIFNKAFIFLSNQGFSIQKPLALLVVSIGLFYLIFCYFGIEEPLGNAIYRTFIPISIVEFIPKWVLAVQSICNSLFLFLLGLGIRNKFKIK
jgi:hypothetical protein